MKQTIYIKKTHPFPWFQVPRGGVGQSLVERVAYRVEGNCGNK